MNKVPIGAFWLLFVAFLISTFVNAVTLAKQGEIMNETGKKVLDVTIGWIGGVCGVLLVDLLTWWYIAENYNITPKG